MRIIIRLIRLIMLIRLMSALSFPILQRETASRSLSPTAGRSKEQLLWEITVTRQGHTIGKTLQSAAATNLDDYTSSAMPQH